MTVNLLYLLDHSSHVPFFVGEDQVGLIRPDAVEQVIQYTDVFCCEKEPLSGKYRKIEIINTAKSFEERSRLVDRVLREIRQKDVLVPLRGWREEV